MTSNSRAVAPSASVLPSGTLDRGSADNLPRRSTLCAWPEVGLTVMSNCLPVGVNMSPIMQGCREHPDRFFRSYFGPVMDTRSMKALRFLTAGDAPPA